AGIAEIIQIGRRWRIRHHEGLERVAALRSGSASSQVARIATAVASSRDGDENGNVAEIEMPANERIAGAGGLAGRGGAGVGGVLLVIHLNQPDRRVPAGAGAV